MTRARDREIEERMHLAFDLMKRVAANPDAYPDDFIVLPVDPAVIQSVLSRERLRLLRTVRRRGQFPSVGALAKALRRDPTRVSRDLNYLKEARLIVIERHGKTKRIRAVDRPILLLV